MEIKKVLANLDALFETHRMDEVEPFLQKHLKQAKEEKDTASTITLVNELIGFYRDLARYDEAISYCEQIVALMKKCGYEGSVPYATTLLNVANAYRAAGKWEESQKNYELVDQIYKKSLEDGDYRYASLYNNWALLYQEKSEFNKAKDCLVSALSIISRYNNTQMEIATTHTNLATTLLRLGEIRDAKDHLIMALSIFEEDGGKDFHYSAALSAMGDAKYLEGDLEAAADYYEKAMEKLKADVGKNQAYERIADNLRIVREKMQKSKEAKEREKKEPVKEAGDMYFMLEEPSEDDFDYDYDEDDEKNDFERNDYDVEHKEEQKPVLDESDIFLNSSYTEEKTSIFEGENPFEEEPTSIYEEGKSVEDPEESVEDSLEMLLEKSMRNISEDDFEEEEKKPQEKSLKEAANEEPIQSAEEELAEGIEQKQDVEKEDAVVSEPVIHQEADLKAFSMKDMDLKDIKPEDLNLEDSEKKEPEESVTEPLLTQGQESRESMKKEETQVSTEDNSISKEALQEIEAFGAKNLSNTTQQDETNMKQRQKIEQLLQTKRKGLEICEAFYKEYGAKMIHEQFPEYEDRIAVGLVGEGSDCFGYDDVVSQDHDFGPGFAMWVTKETYMQIGSVLQRAYDELPQEYMGIRRMDAQNRTGVMIIEDFYEKILGIKGEPKTEIEWYNLPAGVILSATNGKVFKDEEGIFSGIRRRLKDCYPEKVRILKIAEEVARISTFGQYNYPRCMIRRDYVTARIVLGEFMKHSMQMVYLLNRTNEPYYKWLRKGMKDLVILPEIGEILDDIADMKDQRNAWMEDPSSYDSESINENDQVQLTIEIICKLILEELKAQGIVEGDDSYLDHHRVEILTLANNEEALNKQRTISRQRVLKLQQDQKKSTPLYSMSGEEKEKKQEAIYEGIQYQDFVADVPSIPREFWESFGKDDFAFSSVMGEDGVVREVKKEAATEKEEKTEVSKEEELPIAFEQPGDYGLPEVAEEENMQAEEEWKEDSVAELPEAFTEVREQADTLPDTLPDPISDLEDELDGTVILPSNAADTAEAADEINEKMVETAISEDVTNTINTTNNGYFPPLQNEEVKESQRSPMDIFEASLEEAERVAARIEEEKRRQEESWVEEASKPRDNFYRPEENQDLVEKIVLMEWKQFDQVQNEGGRADCQDDWNTFSIMRKSQYMTWPRNLLQSFYHDLSEAEAAGWNLITEKYARMMESTVPARFAAIKDTLPAMSQDKKNVCEQIIRIQVGWMETFAELYPNMAGNARSIHTYEDTPYNTSYETYLRGELGTYSDDTLALYGRMVVNLAKEGKNLAQMIMTNTALLYGYATLDEAEKMLGEA